MKQKYILGKCFFWLVALLLLNSISFAQTDSSPQKKFDRSTPEKLGRMLVLALANADTLLLSQLFPTEQDFMAAVIDAGMPGSDRGEAFAEIPEMVPKIDSLSRGAFAKCFEEYPGEAFPFKKMRIKDIQTIEVPGDLNYADVVVVMRLKGKRLELRLNTVIGTPNGWVLGWEGFEIKRINFR
jgi:hypothetical protein